MPEGDADYYAVLGVAASATPEQIKQAFRAAAKRAHPDAGGSAAAMERVNDAHRVLADPPSRQAYDRLRSLEAEEHRAAAAGPGGDGAGHYTAQEARMRADLHYKMRLAQARASAWRIITRSLSAAAVTQVVVRLLATQITDPTTKFWLAIIGFVPVYGVVLGVIFLCSPEIRLDLHDIVYYTIHRTHNPHLSRFELTALAALAFAFAPLALAWVLLIP